MQDTMAGVETFTVRSDAVRSAYLSLAAAVGLVLLSGLGFLASLRTNVGMFTFQFMTTIPMLFAVGFSARAWSGFRAPREAQIGPEGLRVVSRNGKEQFWPWSQTSLVKEEPRALGFGTRLVVWGLDSRPLVRLTPSFVRYADLAAAVKGRVAAHASAQGAAAERGRARRNGIFLISGAILIWAVAGACLWMAYLDQEARELLATRGAAAQAVVISKSIAPDGRTLRIEYRIADMGESAPVENVEVTRSLWAIVEEGTRLEATAVPGRPDVSRLTSGQLDDPMIPEPRTMLALSLVVAAFAVALFVGGILSLRGIEVTFDSETARFRVRRMGEQRGT